MFITAQYTITSNVNVPECMDECRENVVCAHVCVCIHMYIYTYIHTGFPGSSVSEESACNAGDPGSIPGSGRSTREGIGYQLQYSWASLVAQLVKNLPAIRETWI